MEPLTPRQIQIARRVASGASYKRIAAEFGISVPTVQIHVLDAAAKIGGDVKSPKLRLVLFVLNLEREKGVF